MGGTFLPELVLLKIYTSSWYFQLFFKRGKKLELYWKSRSTSEYVFKKKNLQKFFFQQKLTLIPLLLPVVVVLFSNF